MRYCGRCDEPIDPDEPYDTYIPEVGTGVAATVYQHKDLCRQPPRQTNQTPAPRG
ncbi:hypothetical protein [Streptomyces sp. NPDC018693]|uniref:hypothetical protein n=1 Tax=unclassified Streptomyces TaxID=2593676 RepID=UPI0037B06B49